MVAGTFLSTDLVSGDVVTLAGIPVTITVSDTGIMVNDATVTTPDIVASNGVIHVIDKVLLPPVEGTEVPVEDEISSMPIEVMPGPIEISSMPVEDMPGPDDISMSMPTTSETLFGAKSGKGGKGKKASTKSSKALPVKDAKAEKVISAKSTKLAKVRRD